MIAWIGLAVGIFGIAVSVISWALWLLRKRPQTGNRGMTRPSLGYTALILLPLSLGLFMSSEAIGRFMPSQVLWSVLTPIFGVGVLCCCVTLFLNVSDLRP